ncbi:MAG: plasmid stabilization protein [Sphingomonas sp.]|nr:plasmid stabilization protein [Sphingomonas sp.]
MRIELRPSADRDLDDIFDWIAKDDPDAAERLVRRLIDAIRRLSAFPELGMPRPEIHVEARGLSVGNYLVLYRITSQAVEIVRVVHGAMDVERWI